MTIEEIERLILTNGRRLFMAKDRASKNSFTRRQSSLYSALIQEERYQDRKLEEAAVAAITGP